MMILTAIFIMLCINRTTSNNISQQCDYDLNHTWYVIGIYSACYNQTNRTKQNVLAENLDKTVKNMWAGEGTIEALDEEDKIPVTYRSVDVCNDFNQLPKLIESFY